MFERIRWLTILLPGLTVGAIELISDTALDQALPFPWDTLMVVAVVIALSFVFSRLAFGRIDALAGELARQNAELQRRNATVRALHRVSVAITGISDLERILGTVVDQARELLGADGAALLLDSGAGELAVRARSGEPGVLDIPGRPALIGTATTGSVEGARLEAPLQRGGETIGSLVVGSWIARSYSADELETLASLANQAAIAVENARLQDRLRELAVAEERERIAREMHDGLAQVLGYVNTKSQAVEQLLEDDRVADARAQLHQLASAARSIYVDVREAILGLRSAIDPATGLVPAIEAYARRFAEASKLVVDVRATAAARAVILPPAAQGHLFRVVQESLTNVRKHAEARRARVQLEVESSNLVLSVADDGRGMAPVADRATDWPHYGLAAMRERASAIGGAIDWSRAPEGGTLVRLVVPVPAAVPSAHPDGSVAGDRGAYVTRPGQAS
jgi:nitrate/nitrite-specific signal transduction histidine kinase